VHAANLEAEPVIRARSVQKLPGRIRSRGTCTRAETRKLRHEEHWALCELSFDVFGGEVIGIVGPNGVVSRNIFGFDGVYDPEVARRFETESI
jgi:ABC-type polysaccharide/polyol phosphate transport system ATPase subunit